MFSRVRRLDIAGAKLILKSDVGSELPPGSVELWNPTDTDLEGVLCNSLGSPIKSTALQSHSSPLLQEIVPALFIQLFYGSMNTPDTIYLIKLT